jgi:hypothetical protein
MEICTLCESKMYEMKMQTSEDPTFWSRKYSVYISGTSGATTESFENIEIHTAHSIQKKKKKLMEKYDIHKKLERFGRLDENPHIFLRTSSK